MNWKLGAGASFGGALLIILDRASLGEQYVLGKISNLSIIGFATGNKWWQMGASFGITTTGQWYDYLYAGTNFGSGSYKSYTNGVAGPGTDYLNSGQPDWFGRLDYGGYYDGTVKELIVWTNVLGFTATQISNIHWYSTNTYNYGP